MKYVVFTMIIEGGKVEKWFYGRYETPERAIEVATMLDDMDKTPGIYHHIMDEENARMFGVMNMPE